ncbi:MAG: hypothetical protein A2Y62_13845 [Candidatus Fischerbacteria bacterium RBG_13_37_8]|uniref:Lipoprotein n=1 Tax=Candidatus Fischerbacteria bacterium RBG_13_37_8 TaxID=1817863 RepID=A0A1F5VX73_9BACT|nr:MAG: hypothetical protein A2Y62_13845 [Candidatus Fischerbacteria bacterium RBG_13_37_8]
MVCKKFLGYLVVVILTVACSCNSWVLAKDEQPKKLKGLESYNILERDTTSYYAKFNNPESPTQTPQEQKLSRELATSSNTISIQENKSSEYSQWQKKFKKAKSKKGTGTVLIISGLALEGLAIGYEVNRINNCNYLSCMNAGRSAGYYALSGAGISLIGVGIGLHVDANKDIKNLKYEGDIKGYKLTDRKNEKSNHNSQEEHISQ